MCNVCLQTPCDPRCPNAPDNILGRCKECGVLLWDHDDVWFDNDDNIFCSNSCAVAYHNIRERDVDE